MQNGYLIIPAMKISLTRLLRCTTLIFVAEILSLFSNHYHLFHLTRVTEF